MQVTNLFIESFGEWSTLKLDEFSDGLNVISSANGPQDATITRFIQCMLYGFDDQLGVAPLSQATQSTPTFPSGTLAVNAAAGRHVIRRQDRGPLDDQLSIEGTDGTQHSTDRIPELLSRINRTDFERVFAFGDGQQRRIDQLIDSAVDRNFDVIGGDDSTTRLQELNSELISHRDELSKLPRVETSVELLYERRQRLQDATQRFQHLVDQPDYRREQQLNRLAMEIGELEQRLDHFHDELTSTEAKRERYREELANASDVDSAAPLLSSLTQSQRDQLHSLNEQIDRWTTVFDEVSSRRVALQTKIDEQSWKAAPDMEKADPRTYLRSLESRIEDLQGRVDSTVTGEHWNTAQWSTVHHQFTDTLQDMRDDVYRLCRHLSYLQGATQRATRDNELGHLTRCETELKLAIDKLARQRRDLLNQIRSAFGDNTTLLDPAHDELCICDDHPSLLEEVAPAPLLRVPSANVELQAEIDRLTTIIHQLQADISTVGSRLATAKQQRLDLENDQTPSYDHDYEEQMRELAVVQRQIEDVSRRDELSASIRRLEESIRVLKESSRQPLITREASEFLVQLTSGYLTRIRITAERTVWVQNGAGTWLPYDQLELSRRDQVYFSLCLALTAAFGREGIRLPLLLDEPFRNLKADEVVAAVRLLREFADRGRQIFVYTTQSHIANQFRSQNVYVRELPVYHEPPRIMPMVSPQPELTETINRELDKAYAEAYSDERPVVELSASITTNQPEEVDLHDQYYLWETSPIEDAPSIDGVTGERFRAIHVNSVRDLLRIDPADAVRRLRMEEVTEEMIHRWQLEAALVCHVPRLRHFDARVLVACGVTDPEQLALYSP